MRTACEQKIALGFIPPRRLKQLRQLSHLWWGMGLAFLCSRGVGSFMPLTSSDCRAHASWFETLEQGWQVQPYNLQ